MNANSFYILVSLQKARVFDTIQKQWRLMIKFYDSNANVDNWNTRQSIALSLFTHVGTSKFSLFMLEKLVVAVSLTRFQFFFSHFEHDFSRRNLKIYLLFLNSKFWLAKLSMWGTHCFFNHMQIGQVFILEEMFELFCYFYVHPFHSSSFAH